MSPSGDSLVPGASWSRQHPNYRPLKKGTGHWPSVDLSRAAQLKPVAMTSSLDAIRAASRPPRTPYSRSWDANGTDLELSLLTHDAANGSLSLEEDDVEGDDFKKKDMSSADKRAIALLIALYLVQGIPIGLTLGSVPFLIQDHLSYSQLATFALSSYPYSLKLLWSPIVDSIFIPSVGRRKSWIIPMQIIIGTLMLYISLNVQRLLDDPQNNLFELTLIFTLLIALSATQDIAVDGWALTMLSPENLSYASTCQTVGLNTGFFSSFTVFLAFNSQAFSDKWGIPRLHLSTYLQFWAIVCYGLTLWLAFVTKEDKEIDYKTKMSMTFVYKTIWSICKLPHIQSLIIVHFFAKFGWAANEAVTQLKMVEKGLRREDLALVVLMDFPFQILGGWLAARWSKGENPLRPWVWAMWPRIAFAAIAALMVYFFPKPPISMAFLILITLHTILQSFSSTVQFVSIAAFHNIISDPLIGGTYMTLLATFSNLGGTWPKWFVLRAVDLFTVATCKVPEASEPQISASECVSEQGKALCTKLGGQCIIEEDGYFLTTSLCIGTAVVFTLFYIIPTLRRLEALPTSVWRINGS